MASKKNYRNGFVLKATFFHPKLDEEVSLKGLSSLCPKRQDQRKATEGGGDGMRGVGIPGRKNSHSRHFTQRWEIHVARQSVCVYKNSQHQ